jgi:hypothetical protein
MILCTAWLCTQILDWAMFEYAHYDVMQSSKIKSVFYDLAPASCIIKLFNNFNKFILFHSKLKGLSLEVTSTLAQYFNYCAHKYYTGLCLNMHLNPILYYCAWLCTQMLG